jgi:hypothetical protein
VAVWQSDTNPVVGDRGERRPHHCVLRLVRARAARRLDTRSGGLAFAVLIGCHRRLPTRRSRRCRPWDPEQLVASPVLELIIGHGSWSFQDLPCGSVVSRLGPLVAPLMLCEVRAPGSGAITDLLRKGPETVRDQGSMVTGRPVAVCHRAVRVAQPGVGTAAAGE